MNSLTRLIKLLDVFEDGNGIFTAEQLFARLGYTRSTMYRYLKILADAGLLTSWHGNGYTLGPRIIELNAFIAMNDPLLLASKPEMQGVCKNVPAIVVLCRRYKDKLLCVHQESSLSSPRLDIKIGRSQVMLGCASSRVVLARFGTQQLRKFYDTYAVDVGKSGLGGSLVEVRGKLRAIRELGYDFDRIEGDDGLTSIATALMDSTGVPVGCLTLNLPSKTTPVENMSSFARHVLDASQNICRAISV